MVAVTSCSRTVPRSGRQALRGAGQPATAPPGTPGPARGFENGTLGYPTSAPWLADSKTAAATRMYQNGAIISSPATGRAKSASTAPFRTAWHGTGFENGTLGLPHLSAINCGLKNGGCYQNVPKRAPSSPPPATGAQSQPLRPGSAPPGPRTGFENGTLGYPTRKPDATQAPSNAPRHSRAAQPPGPAPRAAGPSRGPQRPPGAQAKSATPSPSRHADSRTAAATRTVPTTAPSSPPPPPAPKSACTAPSAPPGPARNRLRKRHPRLPHFSAINCGAQRPAAATRTVPKRRHHPASPGHRRAPSRACTAPSCTAWAGTRLRKRHPRLPHQRHQLRTQERRLLPDVPKRRHHLLPRHRRPSRLYGPFRTAWAGTGFENGTLGYPTSAINVRTQRRRLLPELYQNGAIISSPATGPPKSASPAPSAPPGPGTGFENGTLGYPTKRHQAAAPEAGGCYPECTKTAPTSPAPATGAQVSLYGPIGTAWAGTGFRKRHPRLPHRHRKRANTTEHQLHPNVHRRTNHLDTHPRRLHQRRNIRLAPSCRTTQSLRLFLRLPGLAAEGLAAWLAEPHSLKETYESQTDDGNWQLAAALIATASWTGLTAAPAPEARPGLSTASEADRAQAPAPAVVATAALHACIARPLRRPRHPRPRRPPSPTATTEHQWPSTPRRRPREANLRAAHRAEHTFQTPPSSGEQGRGAPATRSTEVDSRYRGPVSSRIRLVTVQLTDVKANIPMDSAVAAVQTTSDYWRTMSNGRISMNVASTETFNSRRASSTQSYADMMNTITNELGWVPGSIFGPSRVRLDALRSPTAPTAAGWSYNGTSGRVIMPLPAALTKSVLTHEFGHVLGLMHANSLECGSGVQDVATNCRWYLRGSVLQRP